MLNVKFVTHLIANRNFAIEWTPQGDMVKTNTLEDVRNLAVRMNYTMTADCTEIIDVESGFIIETVKARVILDD